MKCVRAVEFATVFPRSRAVVATMSFIVEGLRRWGGAKADQFCSSAGTTKDALMRPSPTPSDRKVIGQANAESPNRGCVHSFSHDA